MSYSTNQNISWVHANENTNANTDTKLDGDKLNSTSFIQPNMIFWLLKIQCLGSYKIDIWLKCGILAHTNTIFRVTQILHLHLHMQITVFISWHFLPIWQKVFWTVPYLTGTFCTLDILHSELCSVQIGETSTKEIR